MTLNHILVARDIPERLDDVGAEAGSEHERINHRIVLSNPKGQNWLACSLRCQELIKRTLVRLTNIGMRRKFLQMWRNVVLDI